MQSCVDVWQCNAVAEQDFEHRHHTKLVLVSKHLHLLSMEMLQQPQQHMINLVDPSTPAAAHRASKPPELMFDEHAHADTMRVQPDNCWLVSHSCSSWNILQITRANIADEKTQGLLVWGALSISGVFQNCAW